MAKVRPKHAFIGEADRQVPRLAATDRLAWKLHLMVCVSCRRFRRDILSLRAVSTQLAEAVERPASTLPADARERIRQSLKGS